MPETAAIPDLAVAPLETDVVGRVIRVYDCVSSTNDLALAQPEDGAVFVADRQDAGRGRQGNRWHSAPGLGLWLSVSLRMPPRGLTFAGALAVRDAVLPRVSLEVKWPNDLLCGGRKVCGNLVEHRGGWSALGIGINVGHERDDFPPELRDKAGSLVSATGLPWHRGALLHDVLTVLDRYVLRIRDGNYGLVRSAWARACDMVGREVRRGGVTGRVSGIDENGALLVRTADGMRRLETGELDACGPRGARDYEAWRQTRRPGA